jgi:hypothetical protein
MADQKRLTKAMAERYLTDRGLGVGGMATVYLAQDLTHDRNEADSFFSYLWEWRGLSCPVPVRGWWRRVTQKR